MQKPIDKKNYLISGIFISLLLVLIMVTIFMLNKENPIFSNRISILTEVKSAQNLKVGAAVQLRGIKIGSIKSIEFKNLDTLVIEMGVTYKYQEWIKKDSVIAFRTQGVLGDKFLEISGGQEETPIIQNGDFLTTNESSQLDHIVTKSEDLIVVAGNILTKFDKILSSTETNQLKKILTQVETLSANTNKLVMTLNDKNFTQSMANLKSSSESIQRMTKRIEEGPGTIHALLYDQTLHEDLKSLISGANRNKILKFFIRESIKKNENPN